MIEFEKVQHIRKRAVTTLAHCVGCGGDADFIRLAAAAALFDTTNGDLATFVASNAVHLNTEIDICIPSLLTVMHERTHGNGTRLIGD